VQVERGIDLVYGGGSVGLMGLVSRTVHNGGGHVLGIVPKAVLPRELIGDTPGELKDVSGMHQRKAEMARNSDAFIALPGGYAAACLRACLLGLHWDYWILLASSIPPPAGGCSNEITNGPACCSRCNAGDQSSMTGTPISHPIGPLYITLSLYLLLWAMFG